jgi:hypothetical protein
MMWSIVGIPLAAANNSSVARLLKLRISLISSRLKKRRLNSYLNKFAVMKLFNIKPSSEDTPLDSVLLLQFGKELSIFRAFASINLG